MARKQTHEPDYVRVARRKVKAKKFFYRHFSIYGVFVLFFFSMNVLDNIVDDPWFMYPSLSWGVLVAIHYLLVFGLPGSKAGTKEWEERELAKEIARLAPNEPLVALPPSVEDDKSFSMDEHLELKEVAKEKETSTVYRTDDLV